MFNDCILDSPDHLQIDISIAFTATVDLSEIPAQPQKYMVKLSKNKYQTMKKHETNRNEIILSEHKGHGDVMFWVEL